MTYLKVVLSYPASVAFLFGLHEGAKATGFHLEHPQKFTQFSKFANAFFALLVQHWLLWLIVSALIAIWWTAMVSQPKADSKRTFDSRRASPAKKAKR
ncbi:hypothetical protein [Devosia riboflavina]|uniref:hypothetical protein n=1 Tax=Devosia riboflavina TaxID=46914 RepID=UPI001269BC8D|nr:hypothetical protein [Devosia riboflavina]